ncbi:MAG: VWA domain-containing protein, partial [Desulfatitalea sp.]|nr:VWA domain-containing protein [Desulfatitalea sp.]
MDSDRRVSGQAATVQPRNDFMALAAPLAARVGWDGVETVASSALQIANNHLPTYLGLMDLSVGLIDRLLAITGRDTILALFRLAGRIGAAHPGLAVRLLESSPDAIRRLPPDGASGNGMALLSLLLPSVDQAPLLASRLFQSSPELTARLSAEETAHLTHCLFAAAQADEGAAIRILEMFPGVIDRLPPGDGRAGLNALHTLVARIVPLNARLAENLYKQSPCLVAAMGMSGLHALVRMGQTLGREGWPPAYAMVEAGCHLMPRMGMSGLARTASVGRTIARHCPQTAAAYIQRSPALFDRLGAAGLWAFGGFCSAMARGGSGVAVRFPEQSLGLVDRLLATGDRQRVGAIYALARRTAGSNPMIAHQLLENSPELIVRIGLEGLARFGRAVADLSQSSWTTADALIKVAPAVLDRMGEAGVARVAALGLAIAGQNVYGAVGLLEKTAAVVDRLMPMGGRPLIAMVLDLTEQAAAIHWSVAVRLLEKAPEIIFRSDATALTAIGPQVLAAASRDPLEALALLDISATILAVTDQATLLGIARFWAAVAATDGPGAIAGLKGCPDQIDRLIALGGPEMPARVYSLASGIAQHNQAIARQLVSRAATHLAAAGFDGLGRIAAEALALAAIDADKAVRFAAGEGLSFADFMETIPQGLPLETIKPVLFNYLAALLGFRLSIEAGPRPDIGPRHIVLPAKVREFESDADNFIYYKVMATHLEAHLEFGSFDLDYRRLQPLLERVVRRFGRVPADDAPDNLLDRFYQRFPEPRLAADLVRLLEDHRITRRLQREYPGLAAPIEMVQRHDLKKRAAPDRIRNGKQRAVERITRFLSAGPPVSDLPAAETAILAQAATQSSALDHPEATFEHTLAAAIALYETIDGAFSDTYRPVQSTDRRMNPDQMHRNIGSFAQTARELSDRMHRQEGQQQATAAGAETKGEAAREKPTRARQAPRQSRVPHARHSAEGRRKSLESAAEAEDHRQARFSADQQGASDPSDGMTFSATRIEELLRRLFKEKGLTPNDIEKQTRRMRPDQIDTFLHHADSAVSSGAPLEAEKGTRRYPEWDDALNDYRDNWCRIREQAVPAGDPAFYTRTLAKHTGLLKRVRREFQRMRPEALARRTRQPDGEEIDLDAAIESLIDRRVGLPPSENCYQQTEKRQRDIAVAILVDMSKSTKGDTLGFEKEALIILSEALQSIGDAFAIYGFSGDNRDNVDFYRIKDFENAVSQAVRQRIAGIACGLENRDGAALRHTTAILKGREEHTRLIILISDGKPVDKEYAGRHAIEDTRKALLEARQAGVRTFCITVDQKAPDYLPRMYRHSSWVVVNAVEQ